MTLKSKYRKIGTVMLFIIERGADARFNNFGIRANNCHYFHCRQALYIYRRRPYCPLCNQTAILHSTDHKLDFVAGDVAKFVSLRKYVGSTTFGIQNIETFVSK